ncbi:hypothetical protein D9756_011276 [Leucocoprinus leucothites]|uniref:Uncharacterized protein n=1 Tax=Leucocoprinus leucothites TaxID=201217 RepID=A0A8H5CRG7_9AGAR|nr:hypothetical protein D9756_011276 [Leucoagaricus leucothites]
MRRFTPPTSAGKSGFFGEQDSRDDTIRPQSLAPWGFLPPSTNYLNTRRPSWTPSLPESRDYDRDTLFMSSSYRPSRKRRVEDISSFSPLERNPNSPNSNFNFNFNSNVPGQGPVNTLRRGSVFGGSALPSENIERPRKRIISADVFAEKENFRDLPEASVEPSSPEDGSNLRRSLQIDMKGLVGDAVGNMSISPSSRDVVLAARRGLFILDLESPLEVPRFLPQGGTWDVADVQWNPHPQRDRFIVSTSSEKLLIWDLLLVGKTSIAHILKSHYRAITDINWHTTECDIVASTGIDSWVYAWDLRQPPIGRCFSAFKAGGTQVKWNRKDGNILASSHANEVLIWDRRKGSIPISHIKAHDAKIYGIDWSHSNRNELVTCSLGKTIKTWDIADLFPSTTVDDTKPQPKSIIKTTYPVWRALNLPFGQGILSLPQRGETSLEMYAHVKNDNAGGDGEAGEVGPVEVFEGHTDVVKEFVWRKGGPDEFQLITWSKDRTLRFWPVDTETLQKVGHTPSSSDPTSRGRSRLSKSRLQNQIITYRNPPETQATTPALSNPIGNRPILAEVRAPLPPNRPALSRAHTASNVHVHTSGGGMTGVPTSNNPVMQPHFGSAARASVLETMYGSRSGTTPGADLQPSMSTSATIGSPTSGLSLPHHAATLTKPIPLVSSNTPTNHTATTTANNLNNQDKERGRGWTMSRGNIGGKSVARMDAFTWLSNVKVGGRNTRESSSGADTASGNNSSSRRNNSVSGSGSRVASGLDLARQMQTQGLEQEPEGIEGGVGAKELVLGEEQQIQHEQRAPSGLSRRESQSRTRGRGMGVGMGKSMGQQARQQQGGQSKSQDGSRTRRSVSKSRGILVSEKEVAESQNQLLQDEITSVLTKLASSKIKLEKHDLAKKRTCTLGLHGPWGERSSVFIRITFTFPREYPSFPGPEGTPTIDLERSPLVSMKNRAFMLKRLKAIRERKRPCLESCLKFLLFGGEEEELSRQSFAMDGESSDEDVGPADDVGRGAGVGGGRQIGGKGKEVTVSLLRNHKNLAEPRTTQGAFGPNGELICFFRAPLRLVMQNVRGGKTADSTPQKRPSSTQQSVGPVDDDDHQKREQVDTSQTQMFSYPALLSDAVKRLTLAAVDRSYAPDPRRQKGEDMGRIMTDLLTLSQHRDRQAEAKGGITGDGAQQPLSQGGQAANNQVAVIQVRRSMMYASNINWLDGPDKKVAAGYVFEANTLAGVCEKNAAVAGECRRYDHERVWRTLEALLQNMNSLGKWMSVECEKVARLVFLKIYEDFAKNKDLQMLAMLAVLILQTPYSTIAGPPPPRPQNFQRPSINVLPSSILSPKSNAFDVFTIAQGLNQQPTSPALGRLPPSPIGPALAPSLSSSTSSRGSWTSIFNTGRQFVQDTFNPTLPAPTDLPIHSDRYSISSGSDKLRVPDSPVAPNAGYRRRRDSQLALTPALTMSTGGTANVTTTSRSWTETDPPLHPNRTSSGGGGGSGPNSGASFLPAGTQTGLSGSGPGSGTGATKRPPLNLRWTSSGQSGASGVSEKQFVVFDPPKEEPKSKPVFTDEFIRQLITHVHVYAELLFRWQMYEKRIQLLKAVNKRSHVKEANKGLHHQVGIVQTCTHCGTPLHDKSLECHACHMPRTMALCSICRLPDFQETVSTAIIYRIYPAGAPWKYPSVLLVVAAGALASHIRARRAT